LQDDKDDKMILLKIENTKFILLELFLKEKNILQ